MVNGGNLDGQFGIEAAFMAIKHLKDTYIIALAEEEGSRFPYVFWGSKNIVGLARREDVQHITDAKGVGFVNAMRDAGFDFPAASAAAQRHRGLRRDPYRTGQVLETEGKTIGVVTSIVGQRRYDVRLQGKPTTPAPPR